MLAILALVAALAAGAPATVPAAPTRWVTDDAGMMTPAARQALDARLERYEQATGHQVVVWIGQTIGDADLADWAVRTFAAWKLGKKGVDDGLAVFVLAQDHKIDIEVGYGLEDKVPDAIAKRVIDEQMTPKLKAGDNDGAMNAGVDAILTAIGGEQTASGAAVPPPAPVQQQSRSWTDYLGYGVLILILLIFFGRNPTMLLWMLSGLGGRGGFGGGGGGFGGSDSGGGGGFTGGGGSSGGGGARGGW